MKYAIVKCVNGNFLIDSEWGNLTSAKTQFHGLCQTLWNEPDVLSAHVAIVDEQLDVVEGYKESIHHTTAQPTPEPETTEGE